MASNVQTRSPSVLTGMRRGALLACQWVLLAFLLAGGAQIFLAGLGVFSVTSHGASADSAFSAHRGLGFAMAGAAVIVLMLLAGLADNAALYGGLHALDGLLVLGIAGFLCASARRWRSRMAGS
jgi:hypothetical protein